MLLQDHYLKEKTINLKNYKLVIFFQNKKEFLLSCRILLLGEGEDYVKTYRNCWM